MVTGSAVLAPSSNAGGRRRRADQHVDFVEGALEIGADQLPHALRLEIVGIVVAGRQHVGAGHDAALDLGAEALAARALIQVEQIARMLAAMAVAHAIEARQVRGALGRRHHVVGRHRERQIRQADLLEHRALRAQHLERRADALFDLGIEPRIEELLQQADLQALERLLERRAVVGHRQLDAGGIALIEARPSRPAAAPHPRR